MPRGRHEDQDTHHRERHALGDEADAAHHFDARGNERRGLCVLPEERASHAAETEVSAGSEEREGRRDEDDGAERRGEEGSGDSFDCSLEFARLPIPKLTNSPARDTYATPVPNGPSPRAGVPC